MDESETHRGERPVLRVAFFGTPDVAVPTLRRLIDGPDELVVVVSQPDRGRGRGRKRSPSPVSQLALDAGLELLRPEKVGDAATVEALHAARPDIGVVVAFGQFIPKQVRQLPRLGYLINAHASLLPLYRGASPIAQAILDGQPETGISVMRVEKEMDSGAVALVRRTPIREGENTAELTERLSWLAADAIADALDEIARGRVQWTEQDHAAATVAPKLQKSDGRLDWSLPTRVLIQRIHGLAPRPGAYTVLPGDGADEPETLRILRAEAPGADYAPEAPGTMRVGKDGGEPPLRIATGDGWLVPTEVQRAGGRAMETDAFLRGQPLEDGTRLGEGAASNG